MKKQLKKTIMMIIVIIMTICVARTSSSKISEEKIELAPMGEGMTIEADGTYIYTDATKDGKEVKVKANEKIIKKEKEEGLIDWYEFKGGARKVRYEVYCKYCGWYRKGNLKKGERWNEVCNCPNRTAGVWLEYQ